ncbi:hypothetical protein ACOM2C_15280 [Pseudarthrobacter sp. So.54]
MDSGQLIGLIVGIVVVLAIVIVAIMLGRKRKAAANRTKAVEMREQARTEEIGAREREAKAARAEADAKQAEVEAERLREEARGRQQEAEQVRSGVQDQLRKADELDPDVATGKRGHEQGQATPDVSGTEELRRDRSDRNPGQGGQPSPLRATRPTTLRSPAVSFHPSRATPANPAAILPGTSEDLSARTAALAGRVLRRGPGRRSRGRCPGRCAWRRAWRRAAGRAGRRAPRRRRRSPCRRRLAPRGCRRAAQGSAGASTARTPPFARQDGSGQQQQQGGRAGRWRRGRSTSPDGLYPRGTTVRPGLR